MEMLDAVDAHAATAKIRSFVLATNGCLAVRYDGLAVLEKQKRRRTKKWAEGSIALPSILPSFVVSRLFTR
jgi:hypothetical protein